MYTLEISREESDSIDFVGHRYAWSAALQKLLAYDDDGEPETISLSESEAWELASEFEADTEGGHSFFPMLDPESALSDKLHRFMESIV
jgi:hypothetical protein